VKPYIIVNPAAGSVGDIQLRLEQLHRLSAKEVRVTRHAGEAETLARAAIRAGSDYVIAVGGDGTLNEVINGIATSRRARQVCVGVVPVGTANDFAPDRLGSLETSTPTSIPCAPKKQRRLILSE